MNLNPPVDLIGWMQFVSYSRLQGVEQPPKRAHFGGVSVQSSLSLNLSSLHHNKRVICQAYTPELAEGANTFFKLNVHCKRTSLISFLICLFPSFLASDHEMCFLKRCIMVIYDGADVSCFTDVLLHRNVCFLFAGKTFVGICGSVELCGSVS